MTDEQTLKVIKNPFKKFICILAMKYWRWFQKKIGVKKMIGKQTIIDVTQCPYYKEDKTCTYLPYKSKCEGDCNWTTYKELEEKLLRKEQECEELKLDLIEAKAHGDYLNNLALSKTLDTVSEQLDQLKVENEELKKEVQYLKSEIERIGKQ